MDPSDFILRIYEFLEDNQICFLYGALVLDDPNGSIFDFLLSYEVYCKQRPTGLGATHMLFLNSAKFRKRRRSVPTKSSSSSLPSTLATSASASNLAASASASNLAASAASNLAASAASNLAALAASYGLDRDFNSRQYELPLVPPLNYICSRKCRTGQLPENECKSEHVKKGVLLFYPFKMRDDEGQYSSQYIYLKLEGYLHDDSKHVAAAIKRYVFRREKSDSYKKRREDDKIRQHHLADNIQMQRVVAAKGTGDPAEEPGRLPASERVSEQLEFYDRNVRVGNEVYIPDEILRGIIGNWKT